MSTFDQLNLKPELKKNLVTLGFTDFTPIQKESLPYVLEGKDIIAQAKTGSGKTVAFGLALLQNLDVSNFRIQALVMCPTRELADQVAQEIRKLARLIHNIKVLTLCGGMPFGPQIGSLEHGAHIVVGTPGRIEEHLRKGTLKTSDIRTLVLDEADRMLDMGFQETLDTIVAQLPTKRQSLMFSATYPEQIEKIAQRVLSKPERIKVESVQTAPSIEQKFYRVEQHEQRFVLLMRLLASDQPESAIVFCNTKRDVDEVVDEIKARGYSAIALHGDMDQRQRSEALIRFANHSVSILVATDVAARGLDIQSLDAVFNFQLARDPEVHTHRIGRTGRAGESGVAYTFFNDKDGHRLLDLALDQDPIAQPTLWPESHYDDIPAYQPSMVTLQIDGGKKQKVRPGDIVGALTNGEGIAGDDVGKIAVQDNSAYFAVKRQQLKTALAKISQGKVKGRSFRVRHIRG
ncbi:ATP-dependent RNA helicase DbpA [Reinekea thalattae]|uniref:ATP-dependent RNA helicase DbpA n=1 Tax=Reinekea thalattae TaxID=2593301 RepID=A0A5C8ZAJ7_9GAMM|nr:ATP-dependent RNA helicase DbpA [Reinekea thalattae]TXR54464.1 ATP-dependent RNA helicase DbpA [Reinekea thalattae]